ncbi:MAG: RNA 2',3'-cyclic phosphodiesterase [Candidatus Odinarchaeum yellowstonii]|uniref:RNA 2',3'-cyclic phosphodiesterase n=1 Tax=Odinarchaeota yellowstonii (strain LCB_4) TaxID=1841599 RepID=A0AAF0D338_ODILC|nr:MAG: RNA 2',3'-cyclic phosphodiesterase [Candidatus Odinarchaeum yellowstonii]
MNYIRVFIAADIDDKEIVEKISVVKNSFSDGNIKIKFVEDENLHLTLKFIGEVDERLIPQIEEKMLNIKAAAFTITLKNIGVFTPRYPRVLWIGIENGLAELVKLASAINTNLNSLGFRLEKDFTPHLTIGRIKYVKDKRQLIERIQALKNLDFGSMLIRCFKLKKSTLTPAGPIYQTIKEFKLEGV